MSGRVQTEAQVLAGHEVVPEHFELKLLAPEIARAAQPGQFVHVRCSATTDPLLCRPISLAGADAETGEIRLVVQVIGRGTDLLAQCRPGDRVGLIGPLGRGFTATAVGSKLPPTTAVLVAGGVGVAPLLFLAERLRGEWPALEVTALVGARRAELLVGVAELEALMARVIVTTDDGSAGHHGFPTDLLPDLVSGGDRPVAPTRCVYACGPHEMLKRVAATCADRGVPCQVGLENRMGCGVGACLGCVIEAKNADGSREYARVCCDGPVFDAERIAW
jgi:dihydroorotate dehydrogenase electron transfer subunit